LPRLIDGDNLLGCWPGRKRSDGERRAVAREIARLAIREGRRIVVVFDGSPPPDGHTGADVVYSGAGRKADGVILEILRGQEDRKGWIVVTTDRSLADQCRHMGARVERCDQFRKRLAAAPSEEKPSRADDVSEWLDIFGD
jgi:predicted RNA-binding protein with PIN domain